MKRLIVIPVVAVLLGTGVASAAPATAGSVATTACPTGWGSLPKTVPAVDYSQPLTDIRAGAHPCFDRLVIDIPGTSAADPAGYRVQYVSALHQDASGDVIPIRGGAILEIYADAPSYDPNTGSPTYPGRAGQPLPGVDLAGYRTFVEAKFASSFEGRSQIGVGVRARLPFKVQQLDNRLVIDVAHSWTA
ncbi:hypothetical protein ACIRBX_01490 [Kitasatospora sp. NPDC096147]|uniref:AMIN-like domain-containing (lipo)protein n=1 Tax=Kitasatospora sp. NPDC096147 TaxID=3364093 RepID=UPI00382B6BA9